MTKFNFFIIGFSMDYTMVLYSIWIFCLRYFAPIIMEHLWGKITRQTFKTTQYSRVKQQKLDQSFMLRSMPAPFYLEHTHARIYRRMYILKTNPRTKKSHLHISTHTNTHTHIYTNFVAMLQ